MNEREYIQEEGIDVIQVVQTAWAYRWLILIMAVLTMTGVYLKLEFFTDDVYTAKGVLYVSNRAENSTNQSGVIQRSDIDTSRALSSTYIEILKTTSFLEEVSDSIDGIYQWYQIKSMIKIENLNQTELLSVSVEAKSASDAYLIARTFLAKAPAKLISVYRSGEVEIVDPVRLPTAPNDKGITKNILVGALAGIFLSIAIIFILNYFDNKVHKSEDVAKRYNVVILGEISN